jgi:hypothetical protein
MIYRLRCVSLCLLALTAVTSTASQGQQAFAAGNDQIVAAAPLPQDQLDALLAPIALYPDQLLAQVLMASTYPLDVTEAARFVQQNPSLTGAALDRALQNQNWDPSVLSLTAYPQVLLMMNEVSDWTQRLGEAFLANQQQVMDTVQMLRSRAQAAGNLRSTPQQTVMDQGGIINIEPAQPQYVYVPVYDPTVIYGSWSDSVYIPPYWYPPAVYGYPDLAPGIAAGIFFGTACRISYNHWGWAHPNWRRHDIDVNVGNNYFANRPQYADRWRDGRWAHSPEQRRGVAYRDNGFQGARPGNAALQPRETYRTRDHDATAGSANRASGATATTGCVARAAAIPVPRRPADAANAGDDCATAAAATITAEHDACAAPAAAIVRAFHAAATATIREPDGTAKCAKRAAARLLPAASRTDPDGCPP